MSQNELTYDISDDEINLWELIDIFKSKWHWIVGGGLAGLACAAGFLFLIPSEYEATVVVQPATIGIMSAATPTTTVELVAQTLERLKFATFYSGEMVDACQATSPKNLVNDVKASVIKGNSLLSITYRANSPTVAEACIAKIVEHLIHIQEMVAAPLLKELEDQRASTKQQIDEIERFLASIENRMAQSSRANESLLLMFKKEDLSKLQKLYREQRVQLSAPLTQPMKVLERIYSSEKAVYPKKLMTVAAGLLAGLFVGLLALFINRSWRRYRSMSA